MVDGFKIVALGVLVLLFAIAANYGQDLAYQVHAMLLTALAAVGFVWAIRGVGAPRAEPATGYMNAVIRSSGV